MQAHGFRVYFTPLSGVLFTFPSRYSSTIGLPGVLSLGGWCRLLRTGLLRPRPTQGTASVGQGSAYGAVTRSGPPFQARSATLASSSAAALQPRRRLDADGLGWPPFARRYSGGHSCFPLLRLLGCFGSSGSPPHYGGCRASSAAGCPIRTPADQRPLAPPRGLSRPAASFLASGSLRHPPCALSRLSLSLASGHGLSARPLPATLTRRPRPTRPSRDAGVLLSSSFPPILSKNRGGHRPPLARDRGREPRLDLPRRPAGLPGRRPPQGSPGQTRTAGPHIISVVL